MSTIIDESSANGLTDNNNRLKTNSSVINPKTDNQKQSNSEGISVKLTAQQKKLQDAAAGSQKITNWFIDLSSSIAKPPSSDVEEREKKSKKHDHFKPNYFSPLSVENKSRTNKVDYLKVKGAKSARKKIRPESAKVSPNKHNRRRKFDDNANGSPKITKYFSVKSSSDENTETAESSGLFNYKLTQDDSESLSKKSEEPNSRKDKGKVKTNASSVDRNGNKSTAKENINRKSKKNAEDTRSKNSGTEKLPKRPKKGVSESFRKYGVYIPSFSEILRDHKKFSDYSAKVEKACNFVKEKSKVIKAPLLPTFQVNNHIMVYGCEEMSGKEIREAFFNNKQYCIDIITEKRPSERHNIFKNNRFTKDLMINDASEVFNQIQMKQLARLCFKYLSDYLASDIDPYCFKVLLPELCLKIFIDKHNMTQEDGIEYLYKRSFDTV